MDEEWGPLRSPWGGVVAPCGCPVGGYPALAGARLADARRARNRNGFRHFRSCRKAPEPGAHARWDTDRCLWPMANLGHHPLNPNIKKEKASKLAGFLFFY